MKTHIKTWWGGRREVPVHGFNPALEGFKLQTGIEYQELPNGNVIFSEPSEAIKALNTLLTDYWFDYNTNEFVPYPS